MVKKKIGRPRKYSNILLFPHPEKEKAKRTAKKYRKLGYKARIYKMKVGKKKYHYGIKGGGRMKKIRYVRTKKLKPWKIRY